MTKSYEELLEENKTLWERVNNQGFGLHVAAIELQKEREARQLERHLANDWMSRAEEAERKSNKWRDYFATVAQAVGNSDPATAHYAVTRVSNERDNYKEQLFRLRNAIADLRVLRSSCSDSDDGSFRVHLNEHEFDELCAAVSLTYDE